MAINDYTILIDTTTGRLIRDINSDVQIQPRPFVQGDTYNVIVMGVRPRAGRPVGRVYDFIALPSTIYVALGVVGQRPESGEFTLAYGADTTSALAFNASPDAVETALNALASIIAAGGVSVSGEAGGPYQVTFDDAGVRTAIEATTGGLYPPTSATIYDAREGTVDVPSIQIIALDRQSAALATTFTDLPAAVGTVEEIQAGDAGTGTLEIQRVTIPADTYDGTFALSFDGASTAALPWNIEAADLQLALVAAGTWGTAPEPTVTGQFPSWDITFGGTAANKALATIDVTGLKVPVGKQGEFSLTTAGIEALVAGQASATAKLEVVAVQSAKHATLLQVNAAVLNDGIQNAPETGPTLPEYYTAPEVDALLEDYATTAEVEALVDPLKPIYQLASSAQDFFGGDGVSGTFDDDDVLQFPAEANSVYEVDFFAELQTNVAPPSDGFEVANGRWSLPAGASVAGQWQSVYALEVSPTYLTQPSGQPMSIEGALMVQDTAGTGSLGTLNKCIITTAGTAGTVKLQISCNLQTLTDKITRKAGSFLIARKLDV